MVESIIYKPGEYPLKFSKDGGTTLKILSSLKISTIRKFFKLRKAGLL